MGQGRQTAPELSTVLAMHARHHHAFTTRQPRQHRAPRIDDHGVAVGLAAIGMQAALGRRHDIGQIFNRTSSQ